ncbi:MAG TPA: sigma-54-dependent Fis family transcriptional regulator [Bacteroides sp.]|nr:sigma-54-dependent Fis family transcriptional regulator [Bacteroides sp.]
MTLTRGNILIIDDDPYIILSLQTLLEQHYTNIRTLKNPDGIPGHLNEQQFDVVLLDMNFMAGDTSGEDGLKWLRSIQEEDPNTSVILITAYGGVNIAVEAIKVGAVDFVVKPWQNDKLLSTVSAAFRLSRSSREIDRHKSRERILSSTLEDQYTKFVGDSDQMKSVMAQVDKVAGTNANVLILGENGTGKELVARELHRRSVRSGEVFISVDLGSLTETLFESELFGHLRGAFTGAHEDHTGRLEAASGGTLFFDEIGNLPLSLQSKILSALQNREVFRVGSTKPIEIDIRLICATNQPLRQMAAEGTFRQDLFYRINTVEMEIPPLRERYEDIPLLAESFMSRYAFKYRKEKLQLPSYVIKKLQKFDWPGNVRELQHAIERAVIMSDGNNLKSSDFQFVTEGDPDEKSGEDYNLDNLEKWAVRSCLKKHGGNISKAAIELGLTRGALYRRMEKYGL